MGNRSRWLPFPSSESPRVWISENDTPCNGLKLYNPYSCAGRAGKLLFSCYAASVSPRLPGIKFQDNVVLDNLTYTISERFGFQNSQFSYSMGTAGPHRKITAQITRAGEVVAYAKIGSSAEAKRLIQRENDALMALGQLGLQSVQIPRALQYELLDDQVILCQSAPPGNTRKRPIKPTEEDASFLWELVSRTRAKSSYEDVIKDILHSESPEHHAELYAGLPPTWRNALYYLEEIFSGRTVDVALSHGDYAPWNTFSVTGSIYIFDWEYSAWKMPLLNDFLHYLFATGRLVRGNKPLEMAQTLLRIEDNRFLGSTVMRLGIGSSDIPAYVILYLFTQSVRQYTHSAGFDSYITECVHKILIGQGCLAERRRVLVAAYACEPDEGSEPGVGWNMVTAISEHNDAWVLTRTNNAPKIERLLAEHNNSDIKFCYLDLPRWASFWKKGGRGIRTYYYLWQLLAARKARQLHKEVDFDLAHHVTFVNDWLFTFLGLFGVPFIWGPVGSHPKIPRTLRFDTLTLVKDRLRTSFQSLMRCIDPLFWLSAYRASTIIGIEAGVQNRFPISLFKSKTFLTCSAIGVENVPNYKALDAKRSLRVLSIGRLVPIKGFHLTIRAFAELARTHDDATLTIIGEGPQKMALEILVADLGIVSKVQFKNWLPRKEALMEMGSADVFLFPSFEGGGMVVLEAMANELPVVCLAYGGPGEMVTADCGFRIEVSDIDTTTQSLADALRQLSDSVPMREKLGKGANERVRECYLWEQRSKVIDGWYIDLTSRYFRKGAT